MIDIDPGESSNFDDVLVLARLHRTALDHLGVKAMPKVTGKRGIQIWVPVADGYTFDETRAWVERLSACDRRRRCPRWSAGSGKWPSAVAASDSTTRRTQSTRHSSHRSARGPSPARPCPYRSLGTSSTTRTCDPTDGRSAPSGIALPRSGDPLAPLIGLQQRLPDL